jgi:cell wall-associated NlpC family hydrolase
MEVLAGPADTAGWMLRRLVLPCLLLAAALSGACGATGVTGAPHVDAWAVAPPYLPPPDPSTLADPAPTAARPTAASSLRLSVPRSSGAPTDAEVAAELREAYGGAGGTDLDRAAIDANGLAIIPTTAPRKLVALMQAANAVARKPYVYGGGHGRNPDEIWTDSAYDCSGSVSYALAAAGYLQGPMVSGALATWGEPGPGRWVTIYANGGHAFMVVAGLRFDTSGRQVTGSRWQSADARSYAGFSVRHPRGL